MKLIFALILLTPVFSACQAGSNSGASTNATGQAQAGQSTSLTEDEKHRLYAAALVATDSQLQNELFQKVCERIGIMNADGIPNENYTRFVSEERRHWMLQPEAEAFKRTINTRAKAQEYLRERLLR